MAQPNQRPLSAGQKLLEFILDREPYRLQNSLLGNLNLFDYMNLRHLTQRILHSLDPVVLQTQNLHNPHPALQPNPPAVPLGGQPGPPAVAPPVAPPVPPPGPQLGPPAALPAHPQAAPQNNPNDFLQVYLGAHCDDIRNLQNMLNVPAAQQQIPCTNGPTRRIKMGRCEETNPQSHPPFPTRCFNVCNDCLHSWTNYFHRNITNRLPSRRSTLCKRCSLRLRRQHAPGHSTCTCRRDIFAGRKCHTCRLETELATYAVGDARRRTLERTHRSHKAEGSSRRRWVLYVDPNPTAVRRRAACATPGCGREAWTKHHSRRDPSRNEPAFSMHARACLMCLCCGGEVVP